MRRVEPARDADHELLDAGRARAAAAAPAPGCCRPRCSARRARAGSAGTYGKRSTVRCSGERQLASAARSSKATRRKRCDARLVRLDRVAERVLPHALARDALEVDVGGDEVRAVDEALRLGEQVAVLVDQRLAVPAEVGGRFAEPGRRVQVGREAARRLQADEPVPVVRLADRDVRGRQVDEHRRAGQRGVATTAGSAPRRPRRSRRAIFSSGRSAASKSRSAPNGTSAPSRRTLGRHARCRPAWNWRAS